GSIAAALLELIAERGGLVTRADLDAYEALWSSPAEGRFLGRRVETRRDLSGFPATFESFRGTGADGDGERARVLAVLDALGGAACATGRHAPSRPSRGRACTRSAGWRTPSRVSPRRRSTRSAPGASKCGSGTAATTISAA